MSRQIGYYWVKIEDDWTIGFYASSKRDIWVVIGLSTNINSDYLQEIDEHKITRP